MLIEVKTTNRISTAQLNPVLSLKPPFLQYAKTLRLQLLVAWRCLGIWTLFDIGHARRAKTNLQIDFQTAGQQNLLGVLAGDVFYRLAPGTASRMRIVKESETATSDSALDEVLRKHVPADPAFAHPQP